MSNPILRHQRVKAKDTMPYYLPDVYKIIHRTTTDRIVNGVSTVTYYLTLLDVDNYIENNIELIQQVRLGEAEKGLDYWFEVVG